MISLLWSRTMANTEVINLILQLTKEMLVYMLPIIGLLSGLMLILSFLLHVTINAVKKFWLCGTLQLRICLHRRWLLWLLLLLLRSLFINLGLRVMIKLFKLLFPYPFSYTSRFTQLYVMFCFGFLSAFLVIGVFRFILLLVFILMYLCYRTEFSRYRSNHHDEH